jgi:hypothetical protein
LRFYQKPMLYLFFNNLALFWVKNANFLLICLEKYF